MAHYNELIEMLSEKGITFDTGLTNSELTRVEKVYNISFPETLKVFYKVGLPISDGFYNWRDFSEKNINQIKQIMTYPFDSILKNYDEIDWPDNWGKEPTDIKNTINEKLKTAPPLIPIYSHRYIPSSEDTNQTPPVFSIHDVDVIYYGENLYSYLQIEFGMKSFAEMDEKNIEPVTFWSSLI